MARFGVVVFTAAYVGLLVLVVRSDSFWLDVPFWSLTIGIVAVHLIREHRRKAAGDTPE